MRAPALFLACLIIASSLARADDDDDGVDALPPTMPPTITCAAYKQRFETNIRDLGTLPAPFYTPRKFKPTNLLLSNYDFVQAVIACDEVGMFTGVGVTLAMDEKMEDWMPLITAMLQALDPNMTRSAARSTLDDLEAEAASNARLNKAEPNGNYQGEAAIDIGNYQVFDEPIPGPKTFRIDLRFAPDKR